MMKHLFALLLIAALLVPAASTAIAADLLKAKITLRTGEATTSRTASGRETSVSRVIGPYLLRVVFENALDLPYLLEQRDGKLVIAVDQFTLASMDYFRNLTPVTENLCAALATAPENICGDSIVRGYTTIDGVRVGLDISRAPIPTGSFASQPLYCTGSGENKQSGGSGNVGTITTPEDPTPEMPAYTRPIGKGCPMFDCSDSVIECWTCKDCEHTQDGCSETWKCTQDPPYKPPPMIQGQCMQDPTFFVCTCM